MKLKVKKGENAFKWMGIRLPIFPYFKTYLAYDFKIGPEWWEGDLTEPGIYGVKLPAIGKFNYHRSGANWAIVREGGKLWLYPRYYTKSKLYPLRNYKIELEPDQWYALSIQCYRFLTRWRNWYKYVDIIVSTKTGWKSPPWIGSVGKAVAKRDLTLYIRSK